MKKIKINTLQFCCCFWYLLLSSFLGMTMFFLIRSSKIDSLFSILLSFAFSLILFFVFIKLFNYEPTLNLKEKITKLFGKKISFILVTIISIALFLLGIFMSFDANHFIASQFLFEIPTLIIGFLFVLLVLYLNSKGIEVITRVATILFFINILLFLIPISNQVGELNMNNFKPILENGFTPVLKGSMYVVAINVIPMFIMLIIPKNYIVANKKTNKWLLFFLIFSFIMMFSLTLFTIGILDIYLSEIYQYPAYMVLKRVKLFDFIDRIENLIMLQGIFETFISYSLIIYFINKMTNIKGYIIAFSMLFISYITIKNDTIFNNYSIKITPFIGLAVLLVIMIVFIKSLKKEV